MGSKHVKIDGSYASQIWKINLIWSCLVSLWTFEPTLVSLLSSYFFSIKSILLSVILHLNSHNSACLSHYMKCLGPKIRPRYEYGYVHIHTDTENIYNVHNHIGIRKHSKHSDNSLLLQVRNFYLPFWV